jgi:hypothetical protein
VRDRLRMVLHRRALPVSLAPWRYAEANLSILRDALVEFHTFVVENLDPDGAPVEDYLAGWPEERMAALREVLYAH